MLDKDMNTNSTGYNHVYFVKRKHYSSHHNNENHRKMMWFLKFAFCPSFWHIFATYG